LKIDIKTLRWLFMGLYIAILIGLFGAAYSGNFPDWLLLYSLQGELLWTLLVLAITVVSQAIFILVPGTINLCRPIRRGRLVAPVIIASLMMALLVGAVIISIMGLLDVQGEDWFVYPFWIAIGLSWIVWGIVFFIRYKDTGRYKTLKKLISTIITGSLIELLIAVPSHLIVTRRGGWLVDLLTACGITGGIAVMLWAFGPGIILLFLYERQKKELQYNEKK